MIIDTLRRWIGEAVAKLTLLLAKYAPVEFLSGSPCMLASIEGWTLNS
jgi:hypothetical protein